MHAPVSNGTAALASCARFSIARSQVPFLIEKTFKELGAKYEKAADWNSKACVDGNLVTGQNPQSSEACAQAVVAKLTK